MTTAAPPAKPLTLDLSPVASPAAATLRDKIEKRTATVGVVGLGYVGLPLVKAIHEAGFGVIGYDIDESKVRKLRAGENYIHHLGDDFSRELSKSKRFKATSAPADLRDADAILLCVPTPLDDHSCPNLSYVLDSTKMVAAILRPGQLIVLESTTYPGTTREDMLPILQATGLICGEDFFLAFSPEREDPGRLGSSAATIPKLVGGIDKVSGDLAESLYRGFVKTVHRVSSAEVAESAKLLENIYRAVNIALVNELKTVLNDMGIDIWEVIEAASTKPFGFQAFFPGPGLGGHCIPIDPFYLTWKAKAIGRHTKFIELAGEINSNMPAYVIQQLISALNDEGKPLRGSKIIVIGIAYKPNVDDIRESPAAEIIELLWHGGAEVTYHDPFCPRFPAMRKHQIDLDSLPLTAQTIGGHDCVLIVTNHDNVDYSLIGREAKLVLDTRNAMSKVTGAKARIVKA